MFEKNTAEIAPAEIIKWLDNLIEQRRRYQMGNPNASKMERAIRNYILSTLRDVPNGPV